MTPPFSAEQEARLRQLIREEAPALITEEIDRVAERDVTLLMAELEKASGGPGGGVPN